MLPLVSIPRPVGSFVLNNNNVFVHALRFFHSRADGLGESQDVSSGVGSTGAGERVGVVLVDAGASTEQSVCKKMMTNMGITGNQ